MEINILLWEWNGNVFINYYGMRMGNVVGMRGNRVEKVIPAHLLLKPHLLILVHTHIFDFICLVNSFKILTSLMAFKFSPECFEMHTSQIFDIYIPS